MIGDPAFPGLASGELTLEASSRAHRTWPNDMCTPGRGRGVRALRSYMYRSIVNMLTFQRVSGML
jgi:hypothetical protein